MYLLDLSEGTQVNGQYDLVHMECIWMIGLMVVMLMSHFQAITKFIITKIFITKIILKTIFAITMQCL